MKGFHVTGLVVAATLAMSGPALAQAVAATAPHPRQALREARSGDIALSDASMMAWNIVGAGLGGEIAVTVENDGVEPDRIVSAHTPAGPIGNFSIQTARDGQAVALPAGETAVPAAEAGDASPSAGLSRVTFELTDLSSGRPMSELTTITVVFERAGALTVAARPVSPAPSPAR